MRWLRGIRNTTNKVVSPSSTCFTAFKGDIDSLISEIESHKQGYMGDPPVYEDCKDEYEYNMDNV